MATNAEKLVVAEDAYHRLQIGESARVVVDQNGERVEYTAANRPALRQYIAELKQLIADEAGVYRVRGPAGAYF